MKNEIHFDPTPILFCWFHLSSDCVCVRAYVCNNVTLYADIQLKFPPFFFLLLLLLFVSLIESNSHPVQFCRVSLMIFLSFLPLFYFLLLRLGKNARPASLFFFPDQIKTASSCWTPHPRLWSNFSVIFSFVLILMRARLFIFISRRLPFSLFFFKFFSFVHISGTCYVPLLSPPQLPYIITVY